MVFSVVNLCLILFLFFYYRKKIKKTEKEFNSIYNCLNNVSDTFKSVLSGQTYNTKTLEEVVEWIDIINKIIENRKEEQKLFDSEEKKDKLN